MNTVLIELDLVERPLRILNTDWSVLIGMTQIHLPFMILPLIAVLVAREVEIENASLNLGAGRVRTFFRVTLPLSVPGIVAGTALVFALSYTNFIIPQLLGGGNYTTLAVQVYEFVVVILDWTKGAVRATLLLGSCFVFVLLIVWAGGSRPAGRRPGYRDRRPESAGPALPALPAEWVAGAILYALSGISLVLLIGPSLVVIGISFTEKLYISFPPEGFTLRWYEEFLDHDQLIDSAFVSLRIAVWVTVLTLALGIPSAFSLVRGRYRGRTALSRS